MPAKVPLRCAEHVGFAVFAEALDVDATTEADPARSTGID